MDGRSDSSLLAMPAWRTLCERTGVAIPVYLGGIDREQGTRLLHDTVALFVQHVEDPSRVCLSVDGEANGLDVARQLAAQCGVSVCVAEINRGKLYAARNGVQALLAQTGLDYVAVVDQDGDHFANELLNLIRAAEHIVEHTGNDRVVVIGQRSSRHRPMGFLRGELEEFADRVLLDALAYRAAHSGHPLRLEYAMPMGEFPDFFSGYKLFSRATGQQVFAQRPELEGVSESCYYRHAGEAVMVVEALLGGAYLGAVNRSTFNEQPVSTFGQYNLTQLVADKIIWPCRRLAIPLPFVRQWMANHAPRLLLQTLAPEGQRELERIMQRVLSTLGGDAAVKAAPPIQPLFL